MVESPPRGTRRVWTSPTARRNHMREMLDAPTPQAALAANLQEIRLINSVLGWTGATLRALEEAAGGPLSDGWRYLDVATGSGDLPLAVLRQARRRGRRLEVHALDSSTAVLAEASRFLGSAPVTLHQGDARALPFPDHSFDLVSCALALHHFEPREAVLVLRELARVSCRAWVVVDLQRTLPAYVGARALRLVLRSAMTRHDAPASVLRAYTLPELKALLAEAGLIDALSTARFPFRLLAFGRMAPPHARR